MKKRHYKSCLAKTNFVKLTKEEQIKILVKKEIFTKVKVFSFSEKKGNIGMRKQRAYAEDESHPSQELVEEFYTYVLHLFKNEIDTCFYVFFKDFNNTLYGMEYREQRVIALKMFKTVYDTIDVNHIDLIDIEMSINGIENLKPYNRFQKLKHLRSAQKINIAKYESLVTYLNGDEDYFNTLRFLEDETSENFLTFESYLKVLISLNDRYQFEENAVFSKLGILKETYKKHQNIFMSFDVFKFTYNFIENLEENKPSNIDSMHQALLELNLISNKKGLFVNYINIEHKIPITKVRNPARDINRSHDFRVKKLKETLKKFSQES